MQEENEWLFLSSVMEINPPTYLKMHSVVGTDCSSRDEETALAIHVACKLIKQLHRPINWQRSVMEPGGLGLSENVSRNRLALGVAMAVTSGTAESSTDVPYVPATSLCLRPSLHSAHGCSSLRLEARASLRLSGSVLNSGPGNAMMQ